MQRLLQNGKLYLPHEYNLEKDFERVIVDQAAAIFGKRSIYIDIKKRIGDSILTIPDGYLIDLSFESSPRLYIVENELASHDPFKHIGSQLLKFAISYKASGRKIKAFLLEAILKNEAQHQLLQDALQKAGYRNIDALLEALIFDKPVAAIVIIDQNSVELENVLNQLSMKTDIIEFSTYRAGKDEIHQFTPFNSEIRDFTDSKSRSVEIEELDTIVIPAQEEGFQQVFLGKDCWHAIQISAAMLDRIKYIAAYQTAPTSAITYFAPVSRIEKYQDTNKYIVYFQGAAQKLDNIPLDKNKKGLAPQAPVIPRLRSCSRRKS